MEMISIFKTLFLQWIELEICLEFFLNIRSFGLMFLLTMWQESLKMSFLVNSLLHLRKFTFSEPCLMEMMTWSNWRKQRVYFMMLYLYDLFWCKFIHVASNSWTCISSCIRILLEIAWEYHWIYCSNACSFSFAMWVRVNFNVWSSSCLM